MGWEYSREMKPSSGNCFNFNIFNKGILGAGKCEMFLFFLLTYNMFDYSSDERSDVCLFSRLFQF